MGSWRFSSVVIASRLARNPRRVMVLVQPSPESICVVSHVSPIQLIVKY